MISCRLATKASIAPGRATTQLLKSFNTSITRPTFVGAQHIQLAPASHRCLSSSQSPNIQKFFEKKETELVRKTPAAWPHPGKCRHLNWLVHTNTSSEFNEDQMKGVTVAHREAETASDKAALIATKILRWGLDVATGYKHKEGAMTEEKYMIRNVFLESVAGVPGMVAGMIRHLHSMRRMKRDNGW